jgi:outer membrane receptor protein involved in Fe transport
MKKLSTFLSFSLFLSLVAFAQKPKGSISGVMYDNASNETLIGATVLIQGTNIGSSSDIDGNFSINSLEAGFYTLVASYVGMQTQILKDVRVQAGENVKLDFRLSSDQQLLTEVVVVSTIEKKSVGSLLLLQQKSPSFVTGITSDDMKKSPDRTTGDVLKRVSGTSIQENKFVVIRGLADRYNTALINGLALPSTEPDRKAFAFDLFPSNLLDNLIIYKTATPDLPGEFAGGVILMNTKEIPEQGFTTFNIGTAYNTQTTFKDFDYAQHGKTDYLGFDDGSRNLPSTFPTKLEDNLESYAYSKIIPNDWKISNNNSMRPAQSYQLSLARRKDVFGRDFGLIGALTYNNTPRVQYNERNDFNVDKSQLFAYQDKINKENISLGGLLNFALNLNPLNKLQFNNVYTSTSDNQLVKREGTQYEQERSDKGYSMFYSNTKLVSSQLIGEHSLPEGKFKTKWSLGINQVNRNVPSYRRMLYTKSSQEADAPYIAYIPTGSPSPNYAGRFYGAQQERNYTGGLDFTMPYTTKGARNNFKFGAMLDKRDRDFSARVLGYSGASDPELFAKPMDEIFKSENVKQGGLRLKESTDASDSYKAGSWLAAGYVMAEQSLGKKIRLVGGVRVERYNQHLNSFKIKSSTPVIVDTTFLDVLPSLNLTYNINETSNLRFSASQTVARPNFRELAPFAFYDFLLDASIIGNPDLVRTNVTNLDAKYELFPVMNQTISLSAFYKYFKNPIEQVFNNSQGAGTRTFLFQNSPSAQNLGAELELRFRGNTFFKNVKAAEDFTLFSNLAYIYTELDQGNLPGARIRGLQGQSPYIVNVGLSYAKPEFGFTTSLLFNRIGRRIWAVGQDQYKHTYEAPRSVFDLQLTQRVMKKGEIKLNISDILNQAQIFYQDQDENGSFDATKDTKIASSRFGQNVSLSFSYTF